jgi:hypothetical protein
MILMGSLDILKKVENVIALPQIFGRGRAQHHGKLKKSAQLSNLRTIMNSALLSSSSLQNRFGCNGFMVFNAIFNNISVIS